MVINFVALEGAPEHLVSFRDWKLDSFAGHGGFLFTPPADWKKVDLPKQ
jgi:hypothetical protein